MFDFSEYTSFKRVKTTKYIKVGLVFMKLFRQEQVLFLLVMSVWMKSLSF